MVEISFCRYDEQSALVEFIRSDWKSDHIFVRDPSFLTWHYGQQNLPYVTSDSLSMLIAKHEGRIVGMLGLNGVDFRVGEAVFPGVWTSLWYAAPAVRQLNVGLKLWMHLSRLHDGAISMIGMNPQVRPFFRSLKYTLNEDTPRMICVLDDQTMGRLLAYGGASVDRNIPHLRLKKTTPAWRSRFLGSQDVQSMSPIKWNKIWLDYFAADYVGSDRCSDHIFWRFINHPILAYRVRTIIFQNEAALLISRLETPQGFDRPVLQIVDVIGSFEPAAYLLNEALAEAQTLGTVFADYTGNWPNVVPALTAAGFSELNMTQAECVPRRLQPIQLPSQPLISAFNLGEKITMALRQKGNSAFNFSRADGDQDRPN